MIDRSKWKKDVRIDLNNFDKEWLRQADLVLEYGLEEADAGYKVSEAEKALNVAKATALRKAFDIVKSPVDRVKLEAELDPSYLSALDEYNNTKYEENLNRAAFKAIRRKRISMENYLRGHLNGLWGAPVIPEVETTQEFVRERARDNAKEAETKRRRTVKE